MRIEVSFERAGEATSARVVLPSGSYSVRVPSPLTVSLQESFRGLRWKAAGLDSRGDIFLIEVGTELAQLLFPADQRRLWQTLLSDESRYLEFQFSQESLQILQFPWELLYLEGKFLLDLKGSHLVRLHAAPFAPSPVGSLKILAVSLGTDEGLDYQEERKQIASGITTGDEVKFLLNPAVQELQRTISDFRPSVLHVSGHGGFDDLESCHYLSGAEGKFKTTWLLRAAAENQVQLVVLSTCEGGKAPIEIGAPQAGAVFPIDVVGYNYPVDDATSVLVSKVLYSSLARREDVSSAVAAVRSLRTSDVFSFFNITHLHAMGAPFFRAEVAGDPSQTNTSNSPRLIGREQVLQDLASRSVSTPLSLLAPVGIGAHALAENWAWIEPRLFARPSGPRLSVRMQRPFEFEAGEGPNMILDGLPDRSSLRLIAELPSSLHSALVSHPFRAFPLFLSEVQNLGMAVTEKKIIDENRITDRISRLTEPGRKLLAILIAVRGATSWDGDDAPEFLRTSKSDFATARRELVNAKVAFDIDGLLRISPDILIAGKRVLPDFASLVRDFVRHSAAIHVSAVRVPETASERNIFRVLAIFQMAVFAEDWQTAHALLLLVTPWFDRQGRISELLEAFEIMGEHTDNGEKVVNTGNSAYVYQQVGRYADALAIHQKNERWLRSHSDFEDYTRNLFSAVIAQVDCLVNLNRLEDALPLLREAQAVLKAWDEPLADAEFSILGNQAEILRRQGKYQESVAVFELAIRNAKVAGLEHVTMRFLYALAACATEFDDYSRAAKALRELEKMPGLNSSDELYSKYLDVKAKILEAQGSEAFVHYFFESYEVDLARGDDKGVAASLFHLVRHYARSADKGRAREKLPELRRRVIQLGAADLLERLAEIEEHLRD